MDGSTGSAISLDDKYVADAGRIYLTGVQALVRLPMVQRRIDRAAGFNTAGFVSGYRGSPLGTYDRELWAAKRFLAQDKAKHQRIDTEQDDIGYHQSEYRRSQRAEQRPRGQRNARRNERGETRTHNYPKRFNRTN